MSTPAPAGGGYAALPGSSSAPAHDNVLANGWNAYLRTSLGFLFWRKMSIFLLFVPVSIGLGSTHQSAGAVLATSMLAIIPMAGLLGEVTEQLALYTNQTIGGLLNVTFGNLTELIICILALQQNLFRVVQVRRRVDSLARFGVCVCL